jgi:predicted kinase
MKNKIAIFVCGSGGSGKSTFIRNNLKELVHIDVDIIYEELLISHNLGLKIKNFNESDTKLSNKLFEKAKQLNDCKLQSAISLNQNIVIDGIGRNSDTILLQRKYLESVGYTTYMVVMYAELDVCINRVESRERVYKQNITEDSWYLAYNNIGTYMKEFGNNFLFIYGGSMDYRSKLNAFLKNPKVAKIIL